MSKYTLTILFIFIRQYINKLMICNILRGIKREIKAFASYKPVKQAQKCSSTPLPGPTKTGRGNIATDQIEAAKRYLRKVYPSTAKTVEIAEYCKVSQARAARLMDLLSGTTNKGDSASEYIRTDFLVYYDEDTSEYGIFLDRETGYSAL